MRSPIFLTCFLVALVFITAGPSWAADPDLVTQGRVLLKNDEPAKALELFQKAAEADAKNLDAWIGVTDALIALGRADDAVDAAEKALDAEGEAAAAWLASARAYVAQADAFMNANRPGSQIKLAYMSAEDRARKALKRDEKIAGAWWIRGYSSLGMVDPQAVDYDSVVNCFRKEIELHPTGVDSGRAGFKLGEILWQKKNDVASAKDAFKASVKADPKNPLAWKWLGAAQGRLGGREDAALSFLEAAKLVPTDTYARNQLRTMSIEGSNYDRAVENFGRLLDAVGGLKVEGGPTIGRELAWLLGRAKKTDEALKLIDKIARVDPDDYNNHVYRADALQTAGKVEEAIRELKKAVTMSPGANYPYNWLHRIALGWVQSGNLNDGIEMLEWLFARRESADVANDLGLTHRDKTRNFKKSLEWYLEAVKLAPDNVNILNDAGVIWQYHMRKPDEAMKLYMKALEVGRTKHAADVKAGKFLIGYSDALENAAEIHISRKEYKEAILLLDELLVGKVEGRSQSNRPKALGLRQRAIAGIEGG